MKASISKRSFYIITLAAVFALGACFSPWKADEGSLVISLGGANSRAGFTQEQIYSFSHTITVSGGPGQAQEVTGIEYGNSVSFTVMPGRWNVFVQAFYADGKLAATGEASVSVNAGANPPVQIVMTAVPNTNPDDPELSGEVSIVVEDGTPVAGRTMLTANYSGSEAVNFQWNRDGRAIAGAIGEEYLPTEAGSYTVTANAAGFRSKTSNAVTVIALNEDLAAGFYKAATAGGWEPVLGVDNTSFDSVSDYFANLAGDPALAGNYLWLVGQPLQAGRALDLREGLNLTIRGEGGSQTITVLDGVSSGFSVNGGMGTASLTLGAGITVATSPANMSGNHVVVESGGTFTMAEGSVLTGPAGNGSVYMLSGIFYMTGGAITGNTNSPGALLNGGAIAEMSGNSSISGNTGGVYIQSGSFTMKNGSITGNTAPGSSYSNTGGKGGGVYIMVGTFTMEGGTISGNTAAAEGGNGGQGGGVYVYSQGQGQGNMGFVMKGGTISGNEAEGGQGGGVYIASLGNFTKTGSGVINGGGVPDTGDNVAGAGAGNGHAVYMEETTGRNPQQEKDDTVGAGDDLSSNNDWSATPFPGSVTITLADGSPVPAGGVAVGTVLQARYSIQPAPAEIMYEWIRGTDESAGTTGTFTPDTEGTYTLRVRFPDTQYAIITPVTVDGTITPTARGLYIMSGAAPTYSYMRVTGNADNDISAAVGYVNSNGLTYLLLMDANSTTNGAGLSLNTGKTLTIRGTGPTAREIPVTEGTFTVGGILTLDNIILRGGGEANRNATALVTVNGSLTMNAGSAVTGNIDNSGSGAGGGVDVIGGGLTMNSGSAITDNTCFTGGGVYINGGRLTMNSGSVISGNTAQTGAGGGVYVSGTATVNISGGIIQNNTATSGGGIYINGGTVNLNTGASITTNHTTGTTISNGGGGVYMASGNLNLAGGSIAKNKTTPLDGTGTKGSGGGVHMAGGTFRMTSGAIEQNGSNVDVGGLGNYETSYGGGVYIRGGSFTMEGGVIKGNKSCIQGGGVHIASTGSGSFIKSISSTPGEAFIYGDDMGPTDSNLTDTTNDDNGHAVFHDSTDGDKWRNKTVAGAEAISTEDTEWADPAPTEPTEPTVAGLYEVLTNGWVDTGIAPENPDPDDIGFLAVVINHINDDTEGDANYLFIAPDLTVDMPPPALEQGKIAVKSADTAGNTITYSGEAEFYTSTSGTSLLTVLAGAEITLYNITLAGNAANTGALVNVGTSFAPGGLLVMENGSFVRGNTNNNPDMEGGYYTGGGVNIWESGELSMKAGAIITENHSKGTSAYGGGVFVGWGGTLTMESGSSITGNDAFGDEAGMGGGVYMEAGATFNMNGGTIDYNEADSYYGGAGGGVAIQSYEGETPTTSFTMNNIAKIENNKALGEGPGVSGGVGGGVYIEGDGVTAQMLDGFIRQNTAGTNGGGLYLEGYAGSGEEGASSFTMTSSGNMTISGNTATTGSGGGAWVSNGILAMNNSTATITGNITPGEGASGGGVFVSIGGLLDMNSGSIGGHTTEGYGAGVYLGTGGSIDKTGGTIYGNEGLNPNTAGDIPTSTGHAVFRAGNFYRDDDVTDNLKWNSLMDDDGDTVWVQGS